jgi:hypothetical protein
MIAPPKQHTRLALTALVACIIAGWMLQHPYAGVVHDSQLYTLMAMQRLHPAELANDAFLRFGSQDSFTIFSPLYAAAISLLGLDLAAALLTFLSTVALVGCAWLVARRFASPAMAALGVVFFTVLPSNYGEGAYFRYFEQFLTPRLPAEALVLGALAAALATRWWLAVLCVSVAAALHPVMAAAGAAMLVLTFAAPRWPRLTLAAALGSLIGSIVLLQVIAPRGRFDADWLTIVRSSSPYLNVGTWSIPDWNHLAVICTVLAIGASVTRSPSLRGVCRGLLLTVGCGLLITFVYCDLMNVALFTDLQAWRWTWLATVVAFVLLPVIAGDCRLRGTLGSTAIVLLACGWIFSHEPFACAFLAAAFGCALAPPATGADQPYTKWLLPGACLLLTLGAGLRLIDTVPFLAESNPGETLLVQHTRSLCADGLLPLGLAIALWAALRYGTSIRGAPVLVTALPVLMCCWLLSPTWRAWSHCDYDRIFAAAAPWRAAIPAGTEVLWPDNPVGAWYVLRRPSYWSLAQLVGAIFSRDKAMLMRQRGIAVNEALVSIGALEEKQVLDPSGNPLIYTVALNMGRGAFKTLCQDSEISYFVSWMPFAASPFPPVTVNPSKRQGNLYLYRCADFRS